MRFSSWSTVLSLSLYLLGVSCDPITTTLTIDGISSSSSSSSSASPSPSPFPKVGRESEIDVSASWFTAPIDTIAGDGTKLTTSQIYKSITPDTIAHARQPPSNSSTLPISSWIPATVPGTVLTTLVNNGIYPDPYFETNLKYIPDISVTGPNQYTYWWYSNFTVQSSETHPTTHYWLHLHGIHYEAQVFLNGFEISPNTGAIVARGMFRRHTYAITSLLSTTGVNELALLVKPPPVLGSAAKGGQGGDHIYARNGPVAQFMLGWDWIQATPDRGVGPWDRITISTTECVELRDPYVITTLNDKQDVATWNVWVDIINFCDYNITGSIITQIANTSTQITTSFFLLPVETQLNVSLTSIIQLQPQLWWPTGYGAQPLYTFQIQAVIKGEENYIISDSHTLQVGVRTVSSRVDIGEKSQYATNGRIFSVNGKDIFIRGGNWIATDQLLRYTGDAQRYDTEVRMHAEMGLNLIRVWGGGLTERPYFYSAADRWGVLVMQEFWMTGDNNGRWAGDYNWPDDHTLYKECATDVIKMLRQHASLLFWCLGNELDPTSKNPPPDIATSIISDVANLDRQRWLALSSMTPEFPQHDTLAPADGPYGILPPSDFWKLDVGLTVRTPFNPESGSIGVPPVETMRLFLSESTLADFPQRDATGDQVNAIWNYHLYLPYTTYDPKNPKTVDSDKLYAYGEPKDIDQFCEQAQLVNIQQYKALMEGHNYYMWTNYTGFIIWKTQNPWTGLRGLMYDWYLSQNGCYYGVRHATEPVHVQLNQWGNKGYTVSIVNLMNDGITSAVVNLLIMDIKGNKIDSKIWTLNSLPINAITHIPDVLTWPSNAPPNATLFYQLSISDNSHGYTLLSTNMDWLSDPSLPLDYSQIAALRAPEARVTLTVTTSINPDLPNGDHSVTIVITHGLGVYVAFGVHVQLLHAPYQDTDRVLPAYYSDNYFALMPSAPITVDITIPHYLLYNVSELGICVKAFNVKRFVAKLTGPEQPEQPILAQE